jgi:hypothetical protein
MKATIRSHECKKRSKLASPAATVAGVSWQMQHVCHANRTHGVTRHASDKQATSMRQVETWTHRLLPPFRDEPRFERGRGLTSTHSSAGVSPHGVHPRPSCETWTHSQMSTVRPTGKAASSQLGNAGKNEVTPRPNGSRKSARMGSTTSVRQTATGGRGTHAAWTLYGRHCPSMRAIQSSRRARPVLRARSCCARVCAPVLWGGSPTHGATGPLPAAPNASDGCLSRVDKGSTQRRRGNDQRQRHVVCAPRGAAYATQSRQRMRVRPSSWIRRRTAWGP